MIIHRIFVSHSGSNYEYAHTHDQRTRDMIIVQFGKTRCFLRWYKQFLDGAIDTLPLYVRTYGQIELCGIERASKWEREREREHVRVEHIWFNVYPIFPIRIDVYVSNADVYIDMDSVIYTQIHTIRGPRPSNVAQIHSLTQTHAHIGRPTLFHYLFLFHTIAYTRQFHHQIHWHSDNRAQQTHSTE